MKITCREEALRAFKLGVLSLKERAQIDQLFDSICAQICFLGEAADIPLPKPLQPETRPHPLTYHVNMSGDLSIPLKTDPINSSNETETRNTVS